jgi:hypothetical protein
MSNLVHVLSFTYIFIFMSIQRNATYTHVDLHHGLVYSFFILSRLSKLEAQRDALESTVGTLISQVFFYVDVPKHGSVL